MRRHAGGIGCGAGGRASQARTRAAPGLRLVANKSRPPGAWLTEAVQNWAATKSAARRSKEDAEMARRRAPRISKRECGQTKNNGCATRRAIPLML
jgi:hypothetical protein